MRRVLGLDLLRALAVTLVLFSHTEFFTNSNPKLSPIFHLAGFQGVELFFALSGFLIGRILFKEPISSSQDVTVFYGRRWLRTLPAFIVALVIHAFITHANFESFLNVGSFTANLFPFQTTDGLPFFGVSWTLAVEEWFYFLVPLALLILGTNIYSVAILWFGAVALRIMVTSVFSAGVTYDVLRGTVVLRFDALLAGLLIAGLASKFGPWQTRTKLILRLVYIVGLSMEVLVWLQIPWIQYTSIPFSLFVMPINSIFLGLLIWDMSTAPNFLAVLDRLTFGVFGKIVTYLALISYSIYLYHLAVIDWIRSLSFVGHTGLAATISIIFLAASAGYFAIERPFIKLRDKYLPSK